MDVRWFRHVLWIWLGLALWGPLAVAQEPLDPPPQQPLDPGASLVSPKRIPGLVLDATKFPGNVTVITAEDIEASGATTVQEVIEARINLCVFRSHRRIPCQ